MLYKLFLHIKEHNIKKIFIKFKYFNHEQLNITNFLFFKIKNI